MAWESEEATKHNQRAEMQALSPGRSLRNLTGGPSLRFMFRQWISIPEGPQIATTAKPHIALERGEAKDYEGT